MLSETCKLKIKVSLESELNNYWNRSSILVRNRRMSLFHFLECEYNNLY